MQASSSAATSVDATAYKAMEKLFKGGRPSPLTEEQLGSLIDVESPSTSRGDEVVLQQPAVDGCPAWLQAAKIYSVRGVDGFRLIRCPFSDEAQLRLVCTALRQWIEPPADTNLPTAAGPDTASPAHPYSQLWERHQRDPVGSLLSKLAWATVGYQYLWTERRYDETKRCPLPDELGRLASDLAAACGWSLRAEAAIFNLYGANSTMGGHRDDAEPCQSVPIVSISLGLDAVYLLGGPTKAVTPIAIRLRSGDVVVQGGASRGFVHGVPRVLAGTLPRRLGCDAWESKRELLPFSRWLADNRLNLNVRQVHEEAVRTNRKRMKADAGLVGGNGAAVEHKHDEPPREESVTESLHDESSEPRAERARYE